MASRKSAEHGYNADPEPKHWKWIIKYTVPYVFVYIFRRVVFDLSVEKMLFVCGLETVAEAVSSFLHLTFTANLQKVGPILIKF